MAGSAVLSPPIEARLHDRRSAPISAARVVSVTRAEQYWVFGIVVAAGTAIAAWLTFVIQNLPGDALSRTESALVTVRSAYPHLAAIGFIWPPLPTVLQLPLAAIRPLTFYGFSGGLVSAAFAGMTAVVLLHLLARASVPPLMRWILIALFFLNPFIAFYSANGMSEMPFLACFVLSIYAFLRWGDSDHWGWLVVAAIATALMGLSRYDAVPFAIAFALAVALTRVWRSGLSFDRLEVDLLVYLAPVVFSTGLWVFFNWQILGDPLYFLHSEYSNAFLVRNMVMREDVIRIHQSMFQFGRYVLDISRGLAPFLGASLAILAGLSVKRRDARLLCLIGLLLVIPLFQAVSYRQGQTFGFWRFHITMIPAALIALLEPLRLVRSRIGYRVGLAALVVVMAASNVVTARAMASVPYAPGGCGDPGDRDAMMVYALRHPTRRLDTCAPERDVAKYITSNVHQRDVMADVAGTFVVLFSQRPDLFILLSDPYYGGGAYVVTEKQTGSSQALATLYAGIEEGQPVGLTLRYRSGPVRFYSVDNR